MPKGVMSNIWDIHTAYVYMFFATGRQTKACVFCYDGKGARRLDTILAVKCRHRYGNESSEEVFE
jgi:hypothetical protein